MHTYGYTQYGAAKLTLTTGYYTGPGGWLYYAAGGGVLVVWSPKSRREINTGLSAADAQKVIAELRAYGRFLGTDKAAALRAVGASSESAASAPTPSPLLAVPGLMTGGTTGGAPSTPGLTEQPWFWPVVVGGGALLLLAVARSRGGAARVSARPRARVGRTFDQIVGGR